MAKYIPLDALVEEIYKLKKSHDNWSCMGKCFHKEYENLLSFIDTLEVKEVDLEEEINTQWNKFVDSEGEVEQFSEIAKHFFELGFMHTLSWKDIRLIAEIGEEFMSSEESDAYTDEESYYNAILNKLKEKGLDYKTQRQEIRDIKALKGEEA